MSATIVQVSVSAGGVPKLPVAEAAVGPLGLGGDSQRHTDFHGGPDRAVCLYSLERIEALAAQGHPIAPGCTGENVTVRGLDWQRVLPGVRLRLGGEVVVEITGFAPPCKANRRWFKDGNVSRISHKLHPGWSRAYARVLTSGIVRPGDEVSEVSDFRP